MAEYASSLLFMHFSTERYPLRKKDAFMTPQKQAHEETHVQKLEGKARGYLTKAVLKVHIGPIFHNIIINQRDSLEILCVCFHSSCFPASLFQSSGKKGSKKKKVNAISLVFRKS